MASRSVDPLDEALTSWEERLRLADEDLRQREQEGLTFALAPPELLALAAERDKIALDRDNLSAAYDERASKRDKAGLVRDIAGSERDRRARAVDKDADAGFADRSMSGKDRDEAAGDRGDSHDDRARGRVARERAATDRATAATGRDRGAAQVSAQRREIDGLRAAVETRALIGQAQGLLMARHRLSADAAFALLGRLSQRTNTKLRDVAALLVASADEAERNPLYESTDRMWGGARAERPDQ